MAAPSTELERPEVERVVLEIVADLLRDLGKPERAAAVTPGSSFERDLGLSSLDLLELIVRCESRFETQLPDEIAEEAGTPSGWVDAILEGGWESGARTAYRISPPPTDALGEPASAATIADVLVHHAEADPGRIQIHLLERDSGQGVTYGRLYDEASAVAAGLAAQGLNRNDPVAIMLPHHADFFFAFFGVMLAGGIPVPVYPPTRPDRIEDYVRRQIVVLRRAGVRFLVGFRRIKAVVQILRVNVPTLEVVTTVDALRQTRGRLGLGSVKPADAALLQFTSGSTGHPKAVMLSHASLLANLRGIAAAVDLRPGDAVVCWLPLYSDLGLIGSWLLSLYYAAPITILSPLDFLRRPERWLRAIHDSRGTLSAGPNFAYDLCARRVPAWAIEGIDLSCWRVAVNAGEPVLADTVDRFTRRFQPYGFQPEAMMPCYGLSESTVALTMPPTGRLAVRDRIRRDPFELEGRAEPAAREDRTALCFFSVGRPIEGQEIRLVGEDGQPVGERRLGRLQFRGATTMTGYYRDPGATAAVTTADGWVDSGDYGYLAGGEFFFTGRAREAIVKAGRNLSPLDLESSLGCLPGVLPGSVVAFGVPNASTGAEELVVAAETRATSQEDFRRLEAEITRVTDDYFGVPPDKIELLEPGSLPRTANGKVRRNETRALYRKGRLRVRRRPPWLQVLRLRWENVGALVALGIRRTGTAALRLGTSALAAAVAGTAGWWVRLVRGWTVLPLASRLILRLHGHRFSFQGAAFLDRDRPAVLIANRSGVLDPLVMVAAAPGRVWFADVAALNGLPRSLAYLLRPRVAGYRDGSLTPAAGAIQERTERVLQPGTIVVAFPDSPVGASVFRSRFRLDPFQAALDAKAALHPAAVRQRSQRQQPGERARLRKVTMVILRPPVEVEELVGPSAALEPGKLFALRDRVRDAIGEYHA